MIYLGLQLQSLLFLEDLKFFMIFSFLSKSKYWYQKVGDYSIYYNFRKVVVVDNCTVIGNYAVELLGYCYSLADPAREQIKRLTDESGLSFNCFYYFYLYSIFPYLNFFLLKTQESLEIAILIFISYVLKKQLVQILLICFFFLLLFLNNFKFNFSIIDNLICFYLNFEKCS